MSLRAYALPVLAMTAIVLAANVAVQFPLNGELGPLVLADVLTWGAFVYPFAFVATDINNRLFGSRMARRVVYLGFVLAILSSILVPPLLYAAGLMPFELSGARLARVAMASGLAFLTAQLLDILVFNRLRQKSWWKAPFAAGVAGSVLDTALFFSLAFAPIFWLLGPSEPFALEAAPLFGLLGTEAPRWVSWALGDFVVKLAIALFGLVPYRLIVGAFIPFRDDEVRA